MLIKQDIDMVKIKIKELILFFIFLIKLKPSSFTKEEIFVFKWTEERAPIFTYLRSWRRIMWGKGRGGRRIRCRTDVPYAGTFKSNSRNAV